VRGTIVEIFDEYDKGMANACETNRCYTKIKINEVIYKGTSFNPHIVQNGELLVKFVFTLKKTSKENFPNMDAVYPGLELEDVFEADLEIRPIAVEGGTSVLIYGYKKIKKDD